ncbi:MAG TPA: c-type cytochrome, partial [Flavisolibacter sp.]|nr:c-type cytochrome [Flavisolibacter sp.]
GKSLLSNTARYLGPKGTVARLSNGMNCQNCHLNGGTQNFANPFSATASTYPKYRNRSGRIETVVFRINDCMKRSLNGQELDSTSAEMQAMVAYIQWVGKQVPKGTTPKGAGVEKLPFLSRAASPEKGRQVFLSTCTTCHGKDGQGQRLPDSSGYVYPPLWGEHSYNISAGLYRLSALAGFIKNNMPYGTSWKKPLLTDEQAWDVAAYLVSQPRPVKFFTEDWKDLAKKPYDYPFGPYTDAYTETQHKYGPFTMMKEK